MYLEVQSQSLRQKLNASSSFFPALIKQNQKQKHSSNFLKITIIVKWVGNFGRRQCLALESLCETDALIQIKEQAVDLGSQRGMERNTETWHGGRASNRGSLSSRLQLEMQRSASTPWVFTVGNIIHHCPGSVISRVSSFSYWGIPEKSVWPKTAEVHI